MSYVKIECTYCGRIANIYLYDYSREAKCPTCGDKNTKIVREDDSGRDCFGYNYKGDKNG